jgi:hypothetical protein
MSAASILVKRMHGIVKHRLMLVYLSLLGNVVIFFHKPLFSSQYVFPWDFRGVQLPLISFLAAELHENRFALWNPFTYCGYPIFANIQACFFHPFVLAAAFLSSRTSLDSLPLMLEWIVVLQVWFAGMASYHLFRELEAGPAAAWTGAAIFETGGYFASRAEHIDAMMAMAWMPLAWLAILKLRQTSRSGWLAVLSCALGMSVLGGLPQATLAVFVSSAVLSLFLVALRLSRFLVVAYTACGCVLGIGLAAVQFIPTTQYTQYSVAGNRGDWLGSGGGLYWESLVSLIAPNHYHIFDLERFKGPWDPTFLYLYCSVGGLLLAIFALVGRKNRTTALLGCMGLFGLIWMLGDKTPLWRAIYPWLPEKIRIGIHPEYTYGIFTLALAGLAAMGLDSLRVGNLPRWLIGIVIAIDLFLVGSGRPMNSVSVKQDPGVTRHAFDGSADLLSEVRRYVNQDYPPSRIDTVDASLAWATSAPLTRIPTATGITPMAPENAIQLRLFLHDGNRAGWYYPVENLDSPVLDLMNVRYLVARAKGAERLLSHPRFRHVASLPGNELFENLSVMPRFFLVRQVKPTTSLAEARSLIQKREIDFRRTAIVDRELAPFPPGDSGGTDQIKVLAYQPASLELSIRTSAPAFLVLSETYYPGWKAWLDGKPAPIYPTDIAFRGLVVPPGNHDVRMEFRPTILAISLGVSLCTAILLVILVLSRTRPLAQTRESRKLQAI